MKRALYTIATLLTLLSMLAACAPAAATPAVTQPTSAPQQPAATSAPQQPATEAPVQAEQRILNLHGSARTVPGQEEAWAEVNAAFEAEYGVKVVTRWQGQWSDIAQQLQTSRMANEPVDITTCGANQINGTLVRSGIIKDITEAIKPIQNRWVDGMFDAYTIGGHVWAVPWDVASTSVVLYNATMFEELGIPEPVTYADVVNAAKVIQEQKPDVMPWVHQGKAPWMWPMWFFEAYAQTSGNKSVETTIDFLSGKVKFTGEEQVAAFNALKKFYDDGVLTQASLDTDTEGMRAAFAQQKAAMMYVGTWEMPNVRDSVKDAFEVGAFEFPLVVDADGVVSQHGGGADGCLAIPSFAPAENLDIQLQYLEFISRKENANKILQPALPLLPVVKSITPVDDPLAAEFNSEFIPHTIRFLDWIWPSEVNDAVMQAVPAVMVGQMTAEEAVTNIQDAYDTLVVEKEYVFDWWTKWTDEDWAKVTPESIPAYEVKE